MATRVRCSLRNVQIFSSHVRTKSLAAGQPGQLPVHQFSGSSISTQILPRTEHRMLYDSDLGACLAMEPTAHNSIQG